MRAILFSLSLVLAAGAIACPPPGVTREGLLAMKAAKFDTVDAITANAQALGLLACLGDADPKIRDGIVFEAIQNWTRAKKLTPETLRSLHSQLLATLTGPEDTGGFLKPFAALVLSEVVRADRIEPYLSAEQRIRTAKITAEYLAGTSDYRGFDEKEGWRHRVAHTADIIMQLDLNPKVAKPEIAQMMQAVFTQVGPKGAVFYSYGEPARLLRAVYYAHRRNLLSKGEWSALFDGLAKPAPFATWGDVFTSQAGLAKRHNTMAFLNEAYVAGKTAGDAPGEEFAGFALAAIQAIEK
jgi:hypothetical protein